MATSSTYEHFLNVALHGTLADPVRVPAADEDDPLYDAFVQAAEAAALSWTRLDRPARFTPRWGMNDAGLGGPDTQIAWAQVTPTVEAGERLPVAPAVLTLREALHALDPGARVSGLHVVAPMQAIGVSKTGATVDELEEDRTGVEVRVDAFVPPPGVSDALARRVTSHAHRPLDVTAVAACPPPDLAPAGLWRLAAEPSPSARAPLTSLAFTCRATGDSIHHLLLVAEACFASLADLGADGPAHVKVVSRAAR